jgi:Fur family ferric uptake transcriptional regulator
MSAKSAVDASVAAAAAIAERGARSTRARVDVLATLRSAHEALTHHDVEERLKRRHDIDRVTLYRVLEWLVALGFAHKFAGDDRVWRFSASSQGESGPAHGNGHAHAHFQCVECGKVVCLDEARMPQVPVPPGFRRREVEVTVKGSCDRCSR